MKIVKITIAFSLVIFFTEMVQASFSSYQLEDPYIITKYSNPTDTIPIIDREGDFITDDSYNPFDITPSNVSQEVEYDPASNTYFILEKIGEEYYRTPSYMTFDEYLEWSTKKKEREYFNNLAGLSNPDYKGSDLLDPMQRIDIQSNLVDRLFGGTEINIEPQGNVDISVGANYNTNSNTDTRLRNPWQVPDIDMKIRMNVDGSIGKKLKLGFNYDTQATFDFDRKIKLEFDSEQFSEDDIIKKIEAGNVSLPLKSNLIQGAQSLFGLKTELQFGHLRITALASQQRSEQNNIQIENGASVQKFELAPDDYDENRHFFISHYNRNTYERNLERLPYITSPFKITRMEVWVSDDRPEFQEGTRMVAAIADLGTGETQDMDNPSAPYQPFSLLNQTAILLDNGKVLPDNRVSDLYETLINDEEVQDLDKVARNLSMDYGLKQNRDFEVFQGRLLSPSDYTFNEQLGFISLNVRLRPNQVMGVVYEYYFNTNCDEVYKVGDFYGAQQSVTFDPNDTTRDTIGEPTKIKFVKMLKSSIQNTRLPSWDLMMKNVYPLRTTQLNQEDFEFDIFYEDYSEGNLKKFIPEDGLRNTPLLNIFNLDNLNRFGDPQSDGIFDYIPGVTVIERNGSIVFPVLEPFGSSLDKLLVDPAIAEKYKYQALYDTTVTIARTQPEFNRFKMIGKVKSSTAGEIYLGPFVPRNSVRVTAGSVTLKENVDYEIDYSLGRLRIINEAYLVQGSPINISFEDNTAFSLQQKTMLGLRADYQLSKKSAIGATFLRLKERPLTQKVNIGDDPINNKIFGLDFNYGDEVPWITNVVDKLPFFSTKAASNVSFSAEVAALVPGSNSAIDVDTDEGRKGAVNIDDFEGAVSGFLLGGFNSNQWTLASTPPDIPGHDRDSLLSGVNRALLNWYVIDRSARRSGDESDPYARYIDQKELFDRDVQIGQSELFTFDLSFYPRERGPYNFDIPGGYPGVSSGVSIENQEIRLNNPEERWGGIMRYFPNTDFEAANYEFIEFWVLNPFMDRKDGEVAPNGEAGELVFHLGNVSEDILKDGKQFFENAMEDDEGPATTYLNSPWGKVPINLPVTNVFNNTTAQKQDVGYDGLTDAEEFNLFNEYVTLTGNLPQVAQDPCNDKFIFNNDMSYDNEDVLTNRYKKFNNPEGNFPDNSNINNSQDFVRGNRYPDQEDLNNNKALDQGENFYEYRIPIRNNNGELDIDIPGRYRQTKTIRRDNGPDEEWYRFQIPLNTNDAKFGDINGFRSIQFMRMYLKGFEAAKTFRFAEFQLVRNQWRRSEPICVGADATSTVKFTVDDVGLEENSTKLPFNYVSPKQIQRELIQSTFSNLLQDEKSMALQVDGLEQDCEAAIFKIANLDLTFYERLQMNVHAEYPDGGVPVADNNLAVFVKMGKDFTQNYYEYEKPLLMSNGRGNINDDEVVWLDSNYIDIKLEEFVNLKKDRVGANLPPDVKYTDDTKPGFSILGNPSLGYVKQIQIGVRNKSTNKETITAEVWVNELRATGLKQQGGYAGQARLQVGLADLGEFNAAATYNSIGWGGLDQRLQERSREEAISYDLASTIQLGKFFPEKAKINLPVYAQYSKAIVTPQYDPYEQDITVEESKALRNDPAEVEEVNDRSRETVTVKSINFTNVKTGISTKKQLPWSPNNFSGTYAYTETVKTDPIIKEDVTTEQLTTLEYNYTTKGLTVQPFKFIKSDALKLIGGFNFNLLPNRIGFNTTLNKFRNYRTYREPDLPVFRFDDQRYKWDRNYVLDWNLAKSLRLNFKANVGAIIDELRQTGIADDPTDRPWVNEYNETVVVTNFDQVNTYRNENLKKLGRRKNYSHSLGVNYKVPINLLPMMDWVNVSADYKADYGWKAGALIEIDTFGNGPGNIITNAQNRSLNATFSFDKLYAKSDYLKAIEDGGKSASRKRRSTRRTRTSRNKTNTDPVDDKQQPEEKEDEPRIPSKIERILVRPLLMLRNIKFTYREDLKTMVPGFLGDDYNEDRRTANTSLLGLADGLGSPGLGFAFGSQPDLKTANNNWLTKNQGWFNNSYAFNDQLQQDRRYDIDLKVDLELFKDFEIDIDFSKSYQEKHTEVFKFKDADKGFMQVSGYDVGSYEMSYLPLSTMFKDSYELYQQFTYNRQELSLSLPNNTTEIDTAGYAVGYGADSYIIAVPAFLAAYNGEDVKNVTTDLTGDVKEYGFLPKPNWQIRYDGLSKVPMFKDVLQSFSLKHGYKSSLRINSFYSQIDYDAEDIYKQDRNNNYYSAFEVPAIVIDEQFSPLIGISLKTKSDLNFDFEYKKGRNLDLRLQAKELNERVNSEYVFGFGYTIKNFGGFGKKKKTRRKKKDDDSSDDGDDGGLLGKGNSGNGNKNKTDFVKNLIINVDFSLRDDRTRKYSLISGESGDGRGQKSLSINPNIDYEMNQFLTLRLYFDYNRTTSYVGNIINTNASGGITARFILQ